MIPPPGPLPGRAVFCSSSGGSTLKTDILGIRFDDLTREEAAQAGAGLLRSGSFHYVVTPNPEFILA